MLGIVLVAAYRYGHSVYALLVILLVWILPTVAIWIVATQFEREFAQDKTSIQNDEVDLKTIFRYLSVLTGTLHRICFG